VGKIVVALFFAIAVWGFSLNFFDSTQAVLLGIVSLLVVMWTNHALPLGVVSLFPLLLFPLFHIMPLSHVAPNYSKSIIFLFLGGFMLAIAMQKSNLHLQLSGRLVRLFPQTARGMIYAMAIVSAILSSILSNTTITLMLLPVGLFLTDNKKIKIRILLSIAYGASIGGILTPIGTPPNLLLMGYLDSIGLSSPTFTEWMAMTSPVVLAMLLFMPWLLSIGIGKESIGPVAQSIEPFTKEQKKLLWILGILSFVLLLNTPIKPWYPGLGLDEKGLLLAAGLLLFMPKIELIDWEDSRSIPYEIIFLFGAGFSIAAAFGSTHLAESIADKLTFVHQLPLWLTLFVIALVISFSTEITSNTALASIALPVMAQLYGVHSHKTMLILMVTTVAASYAFMLPIATPPNAIIMSSRIIEVKTMATFGFLIDLFGVVVVSLAAWSIWQGALG